MAAFLSTDASLYPAPGKSRDSCPGREIVEARAGPGQDMIGARAYQTRPKPCKFIWFGSGRGRKPCKIIGFGDGHGFGGDGEPKADSKIVNITVSLACTFILVFGV